MRAETREMNLMFLECEKREEMRQRTEIQRFPLSNLTNWKGQAIEATSKGLADTKKTKTEQHLGGRKHTVLNSHGKCEFA